MWPLRELGLAVILAAGLLYLADGAPDLVAVADAASHEGEYVTVAGTVTDLRGGDGWSSFALVDGQHAIPVWIEETPIDVENQFRQFTGQITRIDNRLTLVADGWK